nr:hypothetical protein [Candidatus Sigynarchaeota archaeon]
MSEAEYYLIDVEVPDVGKVKAHLNRGVMPLTIQVMHKAMQDRFINGRIRWIDDSKKDAFYFDIGMKKGKEGQPTKLKKGEMGYSYKIDAVVVCLDDAATIPFEVAKLGELLENINLLKSAKNGSSIKLKLVK